MVKQVVLFCGEKLDELEGEVNEWLRKHSELHIFTIQMTESEHNNSILILWDVV